MDRAILIVNFGGPRDLAEVEPFLRELLTDQDVIRTRLPAPIHRWIFTRTAKKRALKVVHDYASIGGKSPIFEDTEAVAETLRQKLKEPVLTFHRYLPATHSAFIEAMKKLDLQEILIFPMFPQFTYATTGSIARWFAKIFPSGIINRLRWIKSYPSHPAYVAAFQKCISDYLNQEGLEEAETVLLFSAHGVPLQFVETGDIYETECRLSYEKIGAGFPKALKQLSYQSRFGPEEWLRPYTDEHCQAVLNWHNGRPNVVFVPLSFTSDHVETLFEIEQLYLPLIREKGLRAFRCPALNREQMWIDAIVAIIEDRHALASNQMLLANN